MPYFAILQMRLARRHLDAPIRKRDARKAYLLDELAALTVTREAPRRHLAACRGRSAVMFPEPVRGGPPAATYGPALALCAGCPVVEPCRTAGAGEPAGVWGGTTPADRGIGRRRRTA
ncbi:MAG: WhiB family transcriptional regulator [Actinomycetota bacterium]|nr:WhiB family transcriptional regulator [Actinomycetota bacterium]MDA8355498.1 WhiB family transcriptional regulator [Actinomycetota bacterium]